MKKFTMIFVFAIFVNTFTYAQGAFSRVKINLKTIGIEKTAQSGVDVTEGCTYKGDFLIGDFSANELNKFDNNNISYEIIIEDLNTFYKNRNKGVSREITRELQGDYPVPQNWEYGSMGGFYTLDEVMAELDDMAAQYPNLISVRQAISTDTLTHDGREIYWVKISDNPNVDEDENEVLYTGVHHAREPIGVQQLVYYMWYLLENYDTDEDIQLLVDNTEMYFVPVVNPDGYEYNHQTDPNGGGMWRKNRNNNGDGTYGVDINRNYGYKWGYDNNGSSPITSDETYRGTSAFSEPETRNMRQFCNEHEFKLALNYHSYSNLLLYPWGWTSDVTPDDELFSNFADIMTAENNYTTGPANTTIYEVNGDSNDWMYGEQDSKDEIFAYVPEVGGSNDGFWPSIDRIIPLCKENMLQNIKAAQLVGKYAVVTDNSSEVNNQLSAQLVYDIKRLGLADTEEFTVSLTALDDNVVSTGDADVFENMDLLQMLTDSISYELIAGIEEGTQYKLLLSVDNGTFSLSDTIVKTFGNEVLIFSDNADDMDNWTSQKWDITGSDFVSPLYSITDSPNGDYKANQNAAITMDTMVDLTNINIAYLNYSAKWDIEAAYDYVQVMIKGENDNQYTPLYGRYTKTGGNEYLNSDQPYYDGSSDWVEEKIDISQFAGQKVKIKFVLVTDSYVEEDGFYFDDLSISVISSVTSVNENKNISSIIYPNPVKNSFKLNFNSGGESATQLNIYNSLGKLIKTINLSESSGVVEIDCGFMPAGAYLLRLNAGAQNYGTNWFIKL